MFFTIYEGYIYLEIVAILPEQRKTHGSIRG